MPARAWRTYNAVADIYDGIRPGYPDAVYAAIEAYRHPIDVPRVLEVGVGTSQVDPRWAMIRQVYQRVAPEVARLAALTPDRPDYDPAGEVRSAGFFTGVQQMVVPFEVEYSSAQFLELIGTYASHAVLDRDRRARLHDELAAAIDTELDGRATKPYEALIVLASRRT